MKYRISGGRLITDGGIEEKDLLLSGGIIEDIIGRDAQVSSDYKLIDANGNFVSAGFVDIHQHGGGGSDYMDGALEDYINATEAHLAHGTTSVMPTLLSASTEAILKAIENYKAAKSDSRVRANLLGVHIEGPYISPEQSGAQKPEHIRCFDEKEYTEIYNAADGQRPRDRRGTAPQPRGSHAACQRCCTQQS